MGKQAVFPYKIIKGVKMPLVPVIFYNSADQSKKGSFICLVDSGANLSLLHIEEGRRLSVKWVEDNKLMECACGNNIPSTIGEMLFEIDCEELRGVVLKTRVLFPNPDASFSYLPAQREEEKAIMPLLGRDAFEHFEVTFSEREEKVVFRLLD